MSSGEGRWGYERSLVLKFLLSLGNEIDLSSIL
jgi:hypothetical protein